MSGWMHELVEGHATWLVGVVIFLESMGLPLPGETLLVGAALYAATVGGLQIELIVLFAALGAILGDNVGYLIGRRLGRPALERWGGRIGLTPARLMLGEYLFRKHGPKLVFFGRFTALLRTFAALLAGAGQMPWRRFLFWNALGGVVWTSIYGFGTYALGSQIEGVLGPAGLLFAAVAVGAIIWSGLFIKRHERQLMEEARREKVAALAEE